MPINLLHKLRSFESKILPRSIKNLGLLIESQFYFQKYKFHINKLRIIAVTGTQGKTTTSTMIYEVFQTSGYRVGLISTISAKIGSEDLDTGFHVTTPSPKNLYKYLKLMSDKEIEIVVLEVTAHAIDQNRIHGLKFETVVYTNITDNEHLDYFKTYQNYLATKSTIMTQQYLNKGGTTIINMDDQSYIPLKNIFKQREDIKIIEYGVDKELKDNLLSQIYPSFNIEEHGSYITATLGNTINQKILGTFNIYNSLAAYGALRTFNVKGDVITKSLSNFSLPEGHMDVLISKPFVVILDFAHTPDSFIKALSEARKLITRGGRLISIFGSASERDESKRPILGEIANQYCDLIYLVPEDSRNELISKINKEIIGNLDVQKFECFNEQTILSRSKAIEKALGTAQMGDVIILLGKGHEKSLSIGGVEYDWSDRDEVLKYAKILGIM